MDTKSKHSRHDQFMTQTHLLFFLSITPTRNYCIVHLCKGLFKGFASVETAMNQFNKVMDVDVAC